MPAGGPISKRLDLMDIVALSPWDDWARKPSWRFSTGVDQAKELGCNGPSCMYYDLGGGAGLSALTHLGRRELYYVMARRISARGRSSTGGGASERAERRACCST